MANRSTIVGAVLLLSALCLLAIFGTGNARGGPALSTTVGTIDIPQGRGADAGESPPVTSSASATKAGVPAAKPSSSSPHAYAEASYKFAAPSEQWHVPPAKPNGKRAVITGGAGFIGSQLGHHLHSLGYDVTLIDNMAFGYMDNVIVNGKKFGRFVVADVLDHRVREYTNGADFILHFAALSALPICQSEPQRALEVNVAGTAAMLEAARLGNVSRFLFASTSAVYENNKEAVLDESLAVSPHLYYSLSKHQSEQLVRAAAATYGLDTVTLRFFNVFGPHQDFRRKSPPFTSYIVREIVNGRSPILHSDGKQSRDYIFLTDLLDLVTRAMTTEAARGETFNVASGKAYSVMDMYKITAAMLNSTIEPVFHSPEKFWTAYPQLFAGARPIKKSILVAEVNKNVLGSNEKARRVLGWAPKVSMAEGLQAMVDFIQEKQRSGVDMSSLEVAWK